MKFPIAVLSSVLFFSVFCSAQTQPQPKPPTIEVTGTAEIMVPPDQVVFTLDVTKRNMDMNIAKQEADVALAKILELTRTFGIKPENVKTDYISVEKRYQSIRDPKNRIFDEDGDEIGTKTFLGYDVSTTVIVRLTDLSRFETFFSEAMKTGLTEIGSVKFESSKMIEQKKKARQMAMKAAYDKATAMAGAINQTIGKAISIAEGSLPGVRYGDPNMNANTTNISLPTVSEESDSVATFSPGSIKISSQVNVVFLLN